VKLAIKRYAEMKEQLTEILGKDYAGLKSVKDDGRTWYNAQDVCGVLGIKNSSLAVKGNARIGYFGIDSQDVCKLVNLGKKRLFISERGVYMLILKSRKPAAYMIKSRLSAEVLPAIMRFGMYRPEPEDDVDITTVFDTERKLMKKSAKL
jgi:prophage antirepressor-like protein